LVLGTTKEALGREGRDESPYVTQLVVRQDAGRKARHPLPTVPNDIGDTIIGRIDAQAADGFVAGRAPKRSESLCPSSCIGEVVYLRGRALVSRWRGYIQSRGGLGLQRSDEIDHVPDLRVGILLVDNIRKAHAEMEHNRADGKLIVRIDPSNGL